MDPLASAPLAPASLTAWSLIGSAVAVIAVAAVGLVLRGRASVRIVRRRDAMLLRDGLESLGHAFALFDDRGRLVHCNPRYRAAYPAIADQLVPGAPIDRILAEAALRGDRLAPGESLGDWVRARVDRPLADAEAAWHRLGDGRWYRISEFATGQGGVVKLLTDVTEERRRQAALSHAHRMEVVGRLAAGLAHEFNNILTAVGGFAELAHRSSPAGPVRDHLASVIDGTGRASDLTRQLLDLSRAAERRPEPMAIGPAIEQVEAMLRFLAGPTVRVGVAIEDPALTVVADAAALGHALINLTINARDAMPGGGRLTVTARRRPGDDGGPPLLALSVADTGAGIPESLRDRIFEPFFTTKPAGVGTGLGLALVETTIRQAGGRVTVDSAPGEGTVFTLLLPLAPAAEAASGAAGRPTEPGPADGRTAALAGATGDADPAGRPDGAAAPRRGGAGAATVLVVDDEAPIRDLVALTLESRGYRVLRAADAAAALAEAERQPIGMVLADVVLPDATGPQLAARLGETHPGLPVVFMSGIEPRRPADRRLVPRGAPMIEKPFDEATLTGAVAGVLSPPDDRPALGAPTGTGASAPGGADAPA